MKKRLGILALAAALAFGFASCNNDPEAPPPGGPTPPTIALSDIPGLAGFFDGAESIPAVTNLAQFEQVASLVQPQIGGATSSFQGALRHATSGIQAGTHQVATLLSSYTIASGDADSFRGTLITSEAGYRSGEPMGFNFARTTGSGSLTGVSLGTNNTPNTGRITETETHAYAFRTAAFAGRFIYSQVKVINQDGSHIVGEARVVLRVYGQTGTDVTFELSLTGQDAVDFM
ncbi:MAG: hypothetical protein FWE09_07550 [Treponema sp.]|nr:hypothetical protein [Treponema sp.]